MIRVLLPTLVAVAVAASAQAAPPQPVASITLVQTAPVHRDTINFTYTLPKQSKGDVCGDNPFTRPCAAIQVMCWQGTALVYNRIFPALNNSFYLESGTYPDGTPFWPEGGADCTATLMDYGPKGNGSFTETHWAETTFQVTG